MSENPDDPVSISAVHTHFLATELKNPEKTRFQTLLLLTDVASCISLSLQPPRWKKNTHMLLTPTWQQQPRWPNVHVKPGWRLASCVASAQLPAAITKRKYLMSQTLELLIRSDSLSSPFPPMNPRARLGKRARALKPRLALPQRTGQDRTEKDDPCEEKSSAKLEEKKVLNVISEAKTQTC